MTPEQAASKFISNIPMATDRHLELVEALTILIHAQRAEAVAEATKWQPMETAPKDQPVLVRGSEYMGIPSIAFFDTEQNVWRVETLNTFFTLPTPTHWMPLPAPPEQEGEE
jgi:hypothetical protein